MRTAVVTVCHGNALAASHDLRALLTATFCDFQEGCPDGYYRNGTGKIGRNCVRCPLNAMKCIGPALATVPSRQHQSTIFLGP